MTDEAIEDPYADDQGRIGTAFAAEVGPTLAAIVDDPALWEDPSGDLAQRIVDRAGGALGAAETDVVVGSDAPDAARTEVGGSSAPVVAAADAAPGAERPSRWRQARAGLLGAAAAILLLAAGVVAFSAADDPPAVAAFDAEMTPTGAIPDVQGTIEVTEFDAGLQVELDAPSLPRRSQGSYYEGWLRLADDRLVPIGTFQQGDDVTLWAGVELGGVVEMTITMEEALVDGVDVRAGSGEVVLKVDFPAESG